MRDKKMRNKNIEYKNMLDQEMTEQVKMYFNQLEEKSKDNPLLRIYEASGFITRFLEPIFKTPNGIKGDAFCYMLTTMAGISVAVTAKENSGKNMLENMGDSQYISRTKLETKSGTFWMGDSINKYLYDSPLSVWNMVISLYRKEKGKYNVPDLQLTISENAKKIGNPDVRIWDGTCNPYTEINNAKTTYENVIKKLEPYKLQTEEYPSVFAFALADIILKVEGIFPKDQNCLKMSMETMMFYAHMDV